MKSTPVRNVKRLDKTEGGRRRATSGAETLLICDGQEGAYVIEPKGVSVKSNKTKVKKTRRPRCPKLRKVCEERREGNGKGTRTEGIKRGGLNTYQR